MLSVLFFLLAKKKPKKPNGVNGGLGSEYILTERRVKPMVLSSRPLLGLLWSSENTCDVRHFQFALQIF